MAELKEIKNRIKTVTDTRKITNAMYLIASTKMRKAKTELDNSSQYFNCIKGEIRRVFRIASDIESPYFYPPSGEHELNGAYGYLIITADKGLAGAYNQNVIKKAEALLAKHDDNRLYIVGEYGKHYFESKNIPIERSFLYCAQNPTLHNARKICNVMLDKYLSGELKKIFIIYTDFGKGLNVQPRADRLLPFTRDHFKSHHDDAADEKFEFVPSVEKVLENAMPGYITGYVYGALVDSFCSEQNSRMNAMDAANRNAAEILDKLKLEYNHIRQNNITREIIEVSAGAKSRRRSDNGKGEVFGE